MSNLKNKLKAVRLLPLDYLIKLGRVIKLPNGVLQGNQGVWIPTTLEMDMRKWASEGTKISIQGILDGKLKTEHEWFVQRNWVRP